MPIIRKKLFPAEIYPEDLRYNVGTDTVQSNINDEWVDNPALDPRTQTTFPPRITSDTKCDAAASIVAALQNQLDQTIEAVGNAMTATQIAGLILGLFSFGVFAIFINIALAIADAMLSAGEGALEDALTGAVYDILECILYCNMDENGRIIEGQLGFIQSEVDGQIGGLAAVTLNSMLELAGEGGLNNLASLGTSTGDCSDCTGDTPCALATQDWEFGTVTSTITRCGVTTVTVDSQFVGGITHAVRWGTLATSEPEGCICTSFGATFTVCDDWYYRFPGEADNSFHGPVTHAAFDAAIDGVCVNWLQVNCAFAFTMVATFEACP